MDKTQIIEGKITDFFKKKREQYKALSTDLKLIVSKNKSNNSLKYELWQGQLFLEWANIKEILNLTFIEKIVTSDEAIEKILHGTISRYENEAESTSIQLRIDAFLQYTVLSNRQAYRKITINDII